MAHKINMVMNKERWDGITKSRNFKEVRSGTPKEEDFWNTTESIPGLEKHMIFLDLGCGPGREAFHVAPKVKEYYGVDIHKELIEIAKEHYKEFQDILNISFMVNNGRDLNMFTNTMFDYIYARLLFIHITKANIIRYLKECEWIIKQEGILYVPDMPNDEFWHNGFTESDLRDVLSNFSSVDITKNGNTFILRAVR